MISQNPTDSSRTERPSSPVNGWKVFGIFILAYICLYAVQAAAGVGITLGGRAVGLPLLVRSTLNRLVSAALIIGIFSLAARLAYRRSIWEIAFPPQPPWWADLLVGAGLSGAGMLALFVIYTAAGWLVVDGWAVSSEPFISWLGALWMALLLNALVAFGEEFVFRGFLLSGLVAAWGRWLGLLAMAVPFAAMHLLVGDASATPLPVFVLMLTLPGLLLGWAALRTRSLWLPMGIHFMWNFMQDEILILVPKQPSLALRGWLALVMASKSGCCLRSLCWL